MTKRVATCDRSRWHVLLVMLGLAATWSPIDAGPLSFMPPGASSFAAQSRDEIVDLQVQEAVDHLLQLVMSSHRDNSHYPPFARERLDTLNAQAKTRQLSILLLKDLSGTDVGSEALMASGIVNGKRTIVISQPRLKRLLLEEGGVRPPFTQRQTNNFMLGLVHEAVHLESQQFGGPWTPAERLREELRAWWEVSLRVVRPLRALNQPMHSQFEQVDRAFRACGDEQNCPFVRPIISSSSGGNLR